MKNFIFGIQAIIHGLGDMLAQVAQYQMFWGFAIGFFVSTVMHGFLITEHPKQIPTMFLLDTSKSFSKLHQQKTDGTYDVSYTQFLVRAQKIKFIFGLAITLFFAIIILAVLTY